MDRSYIVDKKFEKLVGPGAVPQKADYENCSFINCDFANSNLSEIHFIDSEFVGSNLSLATLSKTAFKNVKFVNCKLMGLHFETCDPFLLEFRFENCTLNLSSFYGLKIKKTIFENCSLHEADFSYSELLQAVFNNCDLKDAVFAGSNLEKADFETSYGYIIDPERSKVKGAKFSMQGLPGLLQKYDIVIK